MQTIIIRQFIIGLLITLMALSGIAQTLTGQAKTPVVVGEQFYLSFTLNTTGNDFRVPDIKDFDILTQVSQSTSSNFTVINGKMSQSTTTSYTTILQAKKEGTFTIQPATVMVGGKAIKSNPVTITVVKGQAAAQAQQGGNRQQQGGNQAPAATTINANNLYAKISVDKSTVYQGEKILVTQKIYTRVDLVNIENPKLPTFNGFWKEDLLKSTQVQISDETVNGVAYKVATLNKCIAVAQHAGVIEIEPLEIDCIVRERVKQQARQTHSIWDAFDDDPFFGGGSYRNVKCKIKSAPVKITVKALPTNKPAGYTGAVGQFTINSNVNKQKVKTNEAINFNITVSGEGNLKLIDKFNLEFPSDFDKYDPKVVDKITTSAAGISGKRNFEYLLIPRHAGNFVIPSVNFSYFDIQKGKYVELKTPEYKIEVEKGAGEEASTVAVTPTSANKEELKYLSKDIRFIKLKDTDLKNINEHFFGTIAFYSLLSLPFLLGAGLIFFFRKRAREQQDVSSMKSRKANKVALLRFKTANTYLQSKSKEAFYEEISKAIWGYFGDKLSLPLSGLSKENIVQHLETRTIEPEIITSFNEIIDHCEFARFAPISDNYDMDNTYKKSIELISNLERKLR